MAKFWPLPYSVQENHEWRTADMDFPVTSRPPLIYSALMATRRSFPWPAQAQDLDRSYQRRKPKSYSVGPIDDDGDADDTTTAMTIDVHLGPLEALVGRHLRFLPPILPVVILEPGGTRLRVRVRAQPRVRPCSSTTESPVRI